jgi:hypothetical protein
VRAWIAALSLAEEARGPTDAAIGEYREVLKIDPNHPNIHFRIGRTLLARAQAKGDGRRSPRQPPSSSRNCNFIRAMQKQRTNWRRFIARPDNLKMRRNTRDCGRELSQLRRGTRRSCC